MSHVFVSYKREDLAEVETIVYELKRHHFVWFDKTGIPGGADWEAQINLALAEASAMILIVSPEALASKWVEYEYERAIAKNMLVIPLLLRPSQLPYKLSSLQVIDNAATDAFESLIDALPNRSRIWGDGLIPEKELKPSAGFADLASAFPKGVLQPNSDLVGLPIEQTRYAKIYLLGKKGDKLGSLDKFQLALQLNSRSFGLSANTNGAYPQDDFACEIAAHFLTSPSKQIRLFLVQGPLNQPYDQPDRLGFGLNVQRSSEWSDIVKAAQAASRRNPKTSKMQLFINGPAIMTYQLGEINAQYRPYELYQYDFKTNRYACVLKS